MSATEASQNGNNQPAQQQDKRAVQYELQCNDNSDARLAAKAAGIESVDSCTMVCNDKQTTVFVLSPVQLIFDLSQLSSLETFSTAISFW
jgi:hypothetical protein